MGVATTVSVVMQTFQAQSLGIFVQDTFLGFFELLQLGLYSQNFFYCKHFYGNYSLDRSHTPNSKLTFVTETISRLRFSGFYIYAYISSLHTDSRYKSDTLQGVKTVNLTACSRRDFFLYSLPTTV